MHVIAKPLDHVHDHRVLITTAARDLEYKWPTGMHFLQLSAKFVVRDTNSFEQANLRPLTLWHRA